MSDEQSVKRQRLFVGDLEVHPGSHQVFRSGQQIDLTPLSYKLLIALIDASPDLLSHDELVENVWPGRVISPETVTQRVRLLRQALSDDAREPRYVGLVRGEGYRLLADVRSANSAKPTTQRRKPITGGGILILLALTSLGLLTLLKQPADDHGATPEPGTMAVLWFDNLSGDADYDYLSDGLARELADLLRATPGLRVAGTDSSVALKGTRLDDREISRQLRVRHLIRGTFDLDSERVVVTVSIRDPWDEEPPIDQVFSQHRSALPELQRLITAHVLETLNPGEDAIPPSIVTQDPSAHDLLLLARHLEQQLRDQLVVDEDMLEQVIEVYQRATLADSNSAAAYSRLAAVLLYRGDLEAAEPAIRKALELDPDLSEAQYTLGLLRWQRGEADGGEAFARAVALNPDNPAALAELAKWEWHQGRADLARDKLIRALELDRMSLTRYADLGNFYGLCGMKSEAISIAEEVIARFPDPTGFQVAARIFEVAGEIDRAILTATRGLERAPDRSEIRWQIAELYARIGADQRASEYEPEPGVAQLFFSRRYQDLLEVATEQLIDDPGDVKLYYLLGFAYNATGRHANAIRLLTVAGLPHSVYTDARRADAIEAMVTLADAHAQIGELELAGNYARWIEQFMQQHIDVGVQIDWWPYLYQACAIEIQGRTEEAIARLAEVPGTTGLPWYPPLKDLHCFRRLQETPSYISVLQAVDGRMAELRNRAQSASVPSE